MSRVYTDTLEPRKSTQDITLGTSGETISVGANSINVNTVKDKGGNTLWTSDGSGNLSSVNAGLKGNLVLLDTNTFTGASSSDFTTLIDSTYDVYKFEFNAINPATDHQYFSFNGSDDTSSHVYNVDKISNFYFTWNAASGGSPSLTQWDTGQLDNGDAGTVYQRLNMGTDDTGGVAAASCSGELWLFEPANTSKITNWISVGTGIDSSPGVYGVYTSGYFNTTSAINAFNFDIPSYGLNGTIKMYGIT